MLPIRTTDEFERDLEDLSRRDKDLDKLWEIVNTLRREAELDREAYQDHALEGRWSDCRDLHIEGDWLLIYKIKDGYLNLVRTGRHKDIFRSWN
jgi:mRNA interferase YafQ